MPSINLTGRIQDVKRFEGKDGKLPTFIVTTRVQNEYKNKDGEHKGKYGSKFYDSKFFPKTEAQVDLIEKHIAPRKNDSSKITTVTCDLEPVHYVKNGKDVYELQLVAQNFKLEN